MSISKLFPLSTLTVVLVATCLNGLKPVHIDDTAYVRFAEHIAADPAHPYAFDLFWYDAPQPALEILAPPVYLYWLALGVWAAPDQPVVWHLMVFPWLLLLAGSLNWLSQRWRGGNSGWLVAAFVLSPVVLPGINLMLDIPALALSLASLALFSRALDRSSLGGALLAGVTLALAFQTKYTAATMFPVWLGVAWLSESRARWRCLLAGWSAALLGIVLVEAFIAWGHEQSHLLLQLSLKRERFPTPLSVYLGQIALAVPAIALIGLAHAWHRRRQSLFCSVSLIALPCMTILLSVGVWNDVLSPMHATFLGVSWLLLFASPWVLGEQAGQRFLYWYFLCELFYCVYVSPFPAMRRVLGPAVPLALLVLGGNWLPAQNARRWLAGTSIACGMLIWSLDYRQAHLHEQAATAMADRFDDPERTIWFAGHWGWEYYAETSGMRPIIPGRSVVRTGDLVVIPNDVFHQSLELPPTCRRIEQLQVHHSNRLPVTMENYYGGALKLQWQTDRGFIADIYEATAKTTIPSPGLNEAFAKIDSPIAER